jgi:hypothetical protein
VLLHIGMVWLAEVLEFVGDSLRRSNSEAHDGARIFEAPAPGQGAGADPRELVQLTRAAKTPTLPAPGID